MGTCTPSGVNCAKRILRALAAGLSGGVGETRADGGGEDVLLDTGIVEGFMGIGSERICAVIVVCQRQAWRQVILKPTNALSACSLSHFYRASLALLNKSPIPLPNCPIISLCSLSIPSSGIPSIRLSFHRDADIFCNNGLPLKLVTSPCEFTLL